MENSICQFPRKRLISERNVENVRVGVACCMHMGTFDLDVSRSFWGHSVHVSQNWAATEDNLTSRVCVEGIWVLLTLSMSSKRNTCSRFRGK